jgi:6-phosphofructokinase 2
MNPALDMHTEVDAVVADHKLRCGEPRRDPGGGGINVARAIHRLGGQAEALFPCGGAAGDRLKELLEAERVPFEALPISGATRENVNVLEKRSGRHFRFCLPGPALSEPEWRACLARAEKIAPAEFLVASGSLPPGVPPDFYALLAAQARRSGVRFVLDASGEPLRLALAEGVFLAKPSRREFEDLTGESPSDFGRLEELAESLVREGSCEFLVLSLGSAGAVWASRKSRGRAGAPEVAAASAVGAGDAMVAGLVQALAEGRPEREAVAFGIAAGAASVMRPGTQLCIREDVERLLPSVETAVTARSEE